MAVPLAAFVAAAGVALVVANRPIADRPPAETKTAAATSVVEAPPPSTREPAPSALAAVQQQAKDLAGALGETSPPPASAADSAPEFDIVRVERTGEAVVAGRAAPGATVELLRNGEPFDRAVAGQSGQFAMVPPALPPGTYSLTLRARGADGKEVFSNQSVAVALEPSSNDQPMVALMAPDKPTVVLSQSLAQAPDKVAVEAVDIEPNGKLHVSGRARPGAAVRLYLNDSFAASATAGADGHLAVTINEGLAPGNYRVRLDEVEASSGKVTARAEVPLSVPDAVQTASVPAQPTVSSRPQSGATIRRPHLAAAVATVAPDTAARSAVVAPKTATVTVSRGDTLWRISNRALGAGTRYAVIYKANQKQIRNPNLIYPGQTFVVPAAEARR
ncbi:LysM peptidoglycan-binding domain-containing protein [Bradyrhizobium sp. STM 3562]|uniref:LysM peptidoglycan-binding domain-containing protein n=1 Tax=Bradyrhizobium sp. STM 3562 TaxID=578924 RepID=UPI00388E7CDE